MILGAQPLKFAGSIAGDGFETILAAGNPSEDKTLTLPTETGTLLSNTFSIVRSTHSFWFWFG